MGLLSYLGRGLLLALMLVGGWLVASEPGLAWLLKHSDQWLPDGAELQLQQVDATLWQGGKLHGVSYSVDGEEVFSTGQLTLAWQPLKLLRGVVQLDHIGLQDARYQWQGSGDSEPWRPGDLDLPVEIHIGLLSLQRGEIIIGAEGQSLRLHSAELAGSWDGEAITLSKLRLVPAIADAANDDADADIRADAIDTDADGGSLSLQASLQLDRQFSWQASLQLNGLNPALVSAAVSGDINGEIGLAGSLIAAEKDGMRLTLQPLQLQGQLNGYPLSASGSLQIGPQGGQVDSLQIRSGDAEFSAHGWFDLPGDGPGNQKPDGPAAKPVSKVAALQWQLKIPKLEQLLAGARGQISGNGQFSGSGDAARVDGKLSLKGIALKSLRAKQLDASFKLRADVTAASSVRINGSGLMFAEQDISTLDIRLNGPLDKHNIVIALQQAVGSLNMQASGGYQPDSRQWSGSITKLKLSAERLGSWSQLKRSSLKLAPQRIELSQLCLQRSGGADAARLCGKLRWRPDSGNLDVTLKGLSVAVLRPALDESVQKISGVINGELHLDLTAMPTGSAKLTLTPGEFSIRLDRYRTIKVAHHGGHLHTQLQRKQLQAQWQLKIGEHGADGKISIARPALDRDPLNAAMRGDIKLDLAQKGLIDAFFPNVREAEGSLKAQLQLSGSLAEPRVRGSAELVAERALLPMAGIELSDIRLSLQGDGSRQLRLSGGVTSGPGRVELNGTLTLDAKQGWPLKFKLSGERVQALELPQVSALVNPDLSVEIDRKGIKVGGKIVITEARIHLVSLPDQAVSASSDVVIVGPKGKPEASAARPLDVSVTVKLGKKVHFKGFGLDGRMSGSIVLSQQPGKLLSGNGELGLNHATLFFLGERLDVERARLLYIGGPLDAPGLNVRASRDVDDTEVGVTVTGSIKDPTITGFASDPGITSRDALAMLATGLTPDDAGFDQAVRSTAASIGAMAFTNPIASKTGLDQVSFRSGTEGTDDASVYVGKNLSHKLNVGVSVGVKDPGAQSEFITRYKLRKNLHLEAHSSAESSGLDLKYTIELK